MDTGTWPLAGLTVWVRDLQLRLPTPAEISHLARDAGAEPYDSSVPFLAVAEDTPLARQRRTAQAHWAAMGQWTPAKWALILAASVDGTPVGLHNIRAENFAVRAEVATGSWVRGQDQGKGFGTLMAAGALHLAFEGLGAGSAVCEIRTDNTASRRVAEKMGYEPDGIERRAVNGQMVEYNRYRLSASRWRQLRTLRVAVTGLAACRDMFG
ncbi:GNAT family protein [Actinoplanes sp. NPDC049596]|uniref:GNAT family N-acetyltransferase n=1 Tax=unclassified Actinoplanes TaxID=2626549 RepID=UPI003448F8DA